ncbi:MAG: metallophosphoesterase [Pseudomonadales bacterium]|nr:metallophosphoesterase [Pseudomonadales bacterium]
MQHQDGNALRLIHSVAVGLLLTLVAVSAAAQDTWDNVPRIVAIGDLHGDYEQYVRLLQMNGLIDKRLRWTGGDTHLVQLGDVPDRGPDSLKIIRHLMKLEREARRDGGYVHALIGNHEAMNIGGDLRYVSEGEYAALVTRNSARTQHVYVERVYDHLLAQQPELAANKDETMAKLMHQFPEGYVEHRRLWQPGGEIARWVASHNAVIRINGILFCHGGVDPHTPLRPIDDINSEIRAILSSDRAFGPNYANDETSPLWYRGLATHDEQTEEPALQQMLDYYGAQRIVIGHTPTSSGKITARFGGKVIMADVGASAYYGSHLASLVVENGELYSRTPDGVAPLFPVPVAAGK